MAIGTLAAIGLGLSAVGGVMSSNSQSRAASQAADASNYAADRSAEVIRQNYSDSAAALRPWQTQGLAANALLNDSLGIASPQPQIQPMGPQGGLGGQVNPYGGLGGQYDPMGGIGNTWRDRVGRDFGQPQGLGSYTMPTAGTPQPQAPAPSYRDSFGNWIKNSDYGFQFATGANSVNSGYAGAGTVKSGAAMKGLEQFRQNLQQGYRGEYNALLGNQQQMGLGAASAQAGVSQNQGNALANIYTNQGANNANAALMRGQNSFGNTLSTIGGGLFGYGR